MSYNFLVFVALALVAIAFVVLPVFFKRSNKASADAVLQTQVNQALFDENSKQLQEQLSNGEIGQATFDKLKLELEKQLELDQQLQTKSAGNLSPSSVWWIYVAAAVIIPAMAFIFYQQWGAQPDWEIYQTNLTKVRQQERGASEEELRTLNKQLERLIENRLDQRDDNLHTRFLLARTYAELEDYKSALEMYQSILDARPQSPDVLSEMAQVLYLSEGSRFTAEVKAMFDRAIQMSPQNVRTISFAGLSAYQSGAYQVALGYWQMAVDISEPNSQQYQYMLQAMEETKRQLTAAGIEPEEKQVAEVESPKLKLNVSLSEGLDLNPNYRVFIYARAWQGPPMPLAVHDVKVADLPLTLTLDESMNPGMPMKLSQFSEWELVARVSQNGTANAQSGDWQASLGPITEDQSDETFRLVITSRIP